MEDKTFTSEIIKVHENMSREEIDRIINLIKQSDAIERSREMSNRYLEKALIILETLPENQAKTTLKNIAEYIGKRKF